MKKGKRILGFMLGAVLLLTGCGGGVPDDKEALSDVLVDAQTVGRGDLALSNQFVGTVSPEESVYVIPMAQGTVTETFFDVGDEVNAGDVLFKIDDSGAKLQLEQARLSYTNAKQQADSVLTTQQESANLQMDSSYNSALQAYETYQLQWVQAKDAKEKAEDAVSRLQKEIKKLKAAGATEENTPELVELNKTLEELKDLRTKARDGYNSITVAYNAAQRTLDTLDATRALTQGEALEDTKEQLDTSLQLARVGVESAELALSYYQVTTPISGTVIGKNVEVNGMAAASSYAYIIAGEDTMNVTFQVSESVRNTLNKDQKLVVERNGVEYDGVITEVGNAVNAQTGLFQIKAAVFANGRDLPSGVSVKLTCDTYTADNQIIIPYDSVYYDTQGSYVYIVKDGCAVKSYVTTGIFNDESIEINGGIADGDILITSWSPRLLDGVGVDARVADSQSPQNQEDGK